MYFISTHLPQEQVFRFKHNSLEVENLTTPTLTLENSGQSSFGFAVYRVEIVARVLLGSELTEA